MEIRWAPRNDLLLKLRPTQRLSFIQMKIHRRGGGEKVGKRSRVRERGVECNKVSPSLLIYVTRSSRWAVNDPGELGVSAP